MSVKQTAEIILKDMEGSFVGLHNSSEDDIREILYSNSKQKEEEYGLHFDDIPKAAEHIHNILQDRITRSLEG